MEGGAYDRRAEREMTENPHDIRLVISAVDGTILTPDNTLTPRSLAAVQRLRDADIAFTIASRRPPRGLLPLTGPLGLTAPMAALDGGLIVRPDLGVIVEHRLDRSAAETAINALGGGGLDVWVYTADTWLVLGTHGPHVDREAAAVDFRPTIVEGFAEAVPRIVKVVGISDDPLAVLRMTAEVRRRCGSRVLVTNSRPYSIDVTDPLANTGEVVLALSDAFDVPARRVAAIGDGANDVPMFERCGVSIAMGNASPKVQQVARFLAPSNADDGFATAIEQFIL